MKPSIRSLALAFAAAFPPAADAVYLNPDGKGDALIYPYYTVQSANGNAFNTYVSVANHTQAVKIVKVRFREGRSGAPVLEFDVYLSPNDMWTGAVVPAGLEATRPAALVTADASCTNPPIPQGGVEFQNFAYIGTATDGAGDGLDRTREGYIELITMADLDPVHGLGSSAIHIHTTTADIAPRCTGLTGTNLTTTMIGTAGYTAPTGGLSGTLTLINVANGMDFTVNADALDKLATRPFYRQADAGPPVDFNAAEIDPVSDVVTGDFLYRSVWARPVDAVSAVFMRSSWASEYVLDAATRSRTDVIAVFPTKPFYVTAAAGIAPFTARFAWLPACDFGAGEAVSVTMFDRESHGAPVFPIDCGFLCPPGLPVASICPAASVTAVRRPGDSGSALGSTNLGFGFGALNSPFNPPAQNGWMEFAQPSATGTASTGQSTRVNLATGEVITGPHTYRGLPVTGFWVRTFENGTLDCGGVRCQGNYGGSFPLTYKRSITP